jgi:hypothetical protein
MSEVLRLQSFRQMGGEGKRDIEDWFFGFSYLNGVGSFIGVLVAFWPSLT